MVRDQLDFAELDFRAEMDVDLNADNDWLRFDVDCYLGKDKISLADLRAYLDGKKTFLKNVDGQIVKIKNNEELSVLF